MTQIQHNQLVSFIWNIANDVLVNVYNKGDYRKVILPMIVLRRFDAVLEDTKKEVLAMKERLTAANIIQQDEALCAVAGQAFCNSSPFTLKDLKSRTNSQQLKLDFIAYLDGFSANVQDIITKFKFRNEIDTLVEGGVLGLLIEKFVDNRINLSNRPVLFDDGSVRLPALDNHSIGTVFEELLRRFNEENNVTEAGEHFTPRDIVTLMAEIAFVPIMDKITDSSYLIYDGACGTGGILSVSEERLQQLAEARGKRINTHIFGQELQPETYATCKSDLLIKGDGEEANNISFGSTISEDGKAGMKFDFCISNPPFGTPWKRDLENWGLKDKKDITDGRFLIAYDGNPAYSLVPNIGDPQMLFLANNISRMKDTTELGTRIVEVHNGSSLFTGNAGGGESNLRRYIIENDLLEAIIAVPEKMFYNTGIGTFIWIVTNTGIGTFIWIVTNRKESRRKGKIQLIDATGLKSPLRKNLGEKNCEFTPEINEQILRAYMDFEETPISKIFDNSEFGYWEITVDRPKRDEQGILVKNKRGKIEIDKTLRDKEQVPLTYEGGIGAFVRNEILPYTPDAIVNTDDYVIGYELSFTKYFYKPKQLRTLDEIRADIRAIEESTKGLLDNILNE